MMNFLFSCSVIFDGYAGRFDKMDLADRAAVLKLALSLALSAPTVHDHLDSVQTRLNKLRAAKREKFDERRKVIQEEFEKRVAEERALRAVEATKLAEEKAANEKKEREDKAKETKNKAEELTLMAAKAQAVAQAAAAQGIADVPIALASDDPLTAGAVGSRALEASPQATERFGSTPNSIAAKAAAAAAEAMRAAEKAEYEIENPPPPEDSRKRSNKRRRDRRKGSIRAERESALVSPDPIDGSMSVDALKSMESGTDGTASKVAPDTEATAAENRVSAAQREHTAFETKRQAEVDAKLDIDKMFTKDLDAIGIRRREPFGYDRNHNTFWVLGGDFSRLLVQKIKPDTGVESWVSIETLEELDALSASLQTKGVSTCSALGIDPD